MTHCAEPLKVPRILMHRNVDDAKENGEDLVEGVLSLLILDILVPERVRQEVQTDILGAPIKDSSAKVSVSSPAAGRGQWMGKVCKYKNGVLVQAYHDPTAPSTKPHVKVLRDRDNEWNFQSEVKGSAGSNQGLEESVREQSQRVMAALAR